MSDLCYDMNRGSPPSVTEKDCSLLPIFIRDSAQVLAIGDETGCLFAGRGLPLSLLQSMAAQPGLPLLLWAIRAPGVEYRPGPTLWDAEADAVFLCDGRVRLNAEGARRLTARRPAGVFEGVPRACTPMAARVLAGSGALFVPAIAAGAGGAVMAFRQREAPMTRWEADRYLRTAMKDIFHAVQRECLAMGRPQDPAHGARAAAFRRIAAALLARGV